MATTSTKAKSKDAARAETGPLMYVGPNLIDLGLSQNCVYLAIPDNVREAFDEKPELRQLFIPIELYPTVNDQLREGAGFYYEAYQKALQMRVKK